MSSSAATSSSASSSFIDRNDYLSRLERLPLPGANSRLVNNSPNNNNSNNNNNQDPYAVTKQWQRALAASEYLYKSSSSSSTSNETNNQIYNNQRNSERRIVQLHLSLLPTAPSTTLDVSLPPVATGGEVDLFWPSETSVVDETTLELPKLSPIQFPPASSSDKNKNNTICDVDQLIQQQWIPKIQSALKSNIMQLHRFIALRPGGIKNKRWEFEAGSYLSSLPEDEWDVQVEKSSAIVSNNNNNSSSSSSTSSMTTRGIMNAIEGYVFGNTFSSSAASSSTSSSQLQQQQQSTMAIHLKLKLFSTDRSSENRKRLFKGISTIMKHSMEQLKGGEVRDQLDALDSMRSNSSTFFVPTSSQQQSQSPLQNQQQQQHSKNENNNDDDQHPQNIPPSSRKENNTTTVNSSQFDVTSELSFVIHVSESISNEYQFAAIQNQRIVFDIVDNKNNNSDNDFYRNIAFQMLKKTICDELFPASVAASPLPVANKEEFSFYDFVPGVEDTILACVERLANWCKVLYGFSITFGSPLWNRSSNAAVTEENNEHEEKEEEEEEEEARTRRLLQQHQKPPCFSNSAAFLFETPRSDLSSSVISLFIQLTARSSSPTSSPTSSAENNNTHQQNARSSQISPAVNILSSQLDRNGQPVMFSWTNPTSHSSSSAQGVSDDSYYESIAGSVLQYLVDSVPKLQGLYRSLLHQQQSHNHQGAGSSHHNRSGSSNVTSGNASATTSPAISTTRFQQQ